MPIRRSARKTWEGGHPALPWERGRPRPRRGQGALVPNASLARQRSGASRKKYRGCAWAALCGALVLAVSCESPAPGERQFRIWVEDRYAQPFRDGETELWIEAFGDDAVGMHHTLPVLEGREAIRRFGRMVHETFVIDRFDLTVEEVRVEGAWALTRGSFASRFLPRDASQSIAPGVETPATEGKFILLWERQDDGEWRIVLDMGNLNSP